MTLKHKDRLQIYIGGLPESSQRIIRQLIAEGHEAYLDSRITQVATIRAMAEAKIRDIKGLNDEQA